ncbi:MAG: ATP-binding protein [Prevotella sp.]|nr:ATP-binding protein [Prevotella sp.]
MMQQDYNDSNIRTLSGLKHIRHRPGMYIGRLGDGSSPEDGIYILLKEVMDNSIDEFKMNAGDKIEVSVEDGKRVSVRDYGRGIPQGKLIECVSEPNTSAKFESDNTKKVFRNSIGMNGVGIKAVTALSSRFVVSSFRDGKVRTAAFERGVLKKDVIEPTNEKNGTYIFFEPDDTKFLNYSFHDDILENMMKIYSYVNVGLAIILNGQRFISHRGLEDLLQDRMTSDSLYSLIHIKGNDIDIVFTHTCQDNEEYFSFANGQYTHYGGTHQSAFKECIARTLRDYFGKYEFADIRAGIVAAIAINIENPIFDGQTKGKLNSNAMLPDGISVNKFVGEFIGKEVDNYLRRHTDVAQIIEQKIKDSERKHKDMSGVTKIVRERTKKASLHNRKLRDCRIHYCDLKNKQREESCIFITEGDSASGSITKIRNVNTQAVFSLKGKVLNAYGKKMKSICENEELILLRAALNIEESLDTLRYNKVIVATDADYDGMHIRLLVITFLLQLYPELIRQGHVYVLQTPLFRVRNRRTKIKNKEVLDDENSKNGVKKEFITRYCYSEEERQKAIKDLGPEPEITRFKGLGEISPEEFSVFIGPDIRLEQVRIGENEDIEEILKFFMGENTKERQQYIIDNLRVEE